MIWELLNNAIPFVGIPVVGSLGYWPYHKHLFGIYGEEEKLSYSQEKIPFDESTQKVIDEVGIVFTVEVRKIWTPEELL